MGFKKEIEIEKGRGGYSAIFKGFCVWGVGCGTAGSFWLLVEREKGGGEIRSG